MAPSITSRTAIAASVEWKVAMTRRRDLRGEKEKGGERVVMCWRSKARLEGENISMSLRFVIKRVFDGGDGSIRGGILERSRERGVLRREEVREDGGEAVSVAMIRSEVVRLGRSICGIV